MVKLLNFILSTTNETCCNNYGSRCLLSAWHMHKYTHSHVVFMHPTFLGLATSLYLSYICILICTSSANNIQDSNLRSRYQVCQAHMSMSYNNSYLQNLNKNKITWVRNEIGGHTIKTQVRKWYVENDSNKWPSRNLYHVFPSPFAWLSCL